MRNLVKCISVALGLVIQAVAPAVAQTPPPNVKISAASAQIQNEEQIWINLTDSLNVVAAWRDFRQGFRRVAVGVSTDAGATWTDSLIVGDHAWQSDPAMVGARSGTFYLTTLDFSSNFDSSQLAVWRSTDGGLAWSGPVQVAPIGETWFEDKEFTAVDRTGGLHDGNFYVCWARQNAFCGSCFNMMQIMFARSTDGAQSFDTALTIGPLTGSGCGSFGHNAMSTPIVNSDGSIHVFWDGFDIDSNTCQSTPAIRHVYSMDGGATFTKDSVAFLTDAEDFCIDGNIWVYPMPAGDADISGGPYDGTIYIAQTQHANGDPSETDIEVRKSTDNGINWSVPTVVNDDEPGQLVDQFHPWLIVNEDGLIVMVFYDQRMDSSSHFELDCFFSASFDGAETFIHNYRVSSASTNPDLLGGGNGCPAPLTGALDGRDSRAAWSASSRAGRIAEYIGIHAKHDYVVTAWTDTRDGFADVYSARFTIPFMEPRLYLPVDQGQHSDSVVAFRWSTCWHETEDSYRLEIATDTTFTNMVELYTGLTDNNFAPGTPLSGGPYYWRVKAFRTEGDSTGYSETFTFVIECPVDKTGDVNVDGAFTSADIIKLVNYVFKGGDPPQPVPEAGDTDCSGAVTSADIIQLVNHVFKGGPEPCDVCSIL